MYICDHHDVVDYANHVIVPHTWLHATCLGKETCCHHILQELTLHVLLDRQLMSLANMGLICRSLEEPMGLGPSLSMSP